MEKKRIAWNKGKTGIYSKESLEKMGRWQRGRKLSEETRKKMSIAKKGEMPKNINQLITLQRTTERRKKVSQEKKGVKCSMEAKKKIRDSQKGEKSPHWKGGLTPLKSLIRHCFQYRQWRSDVFTRDNFTCQKCGARSGNGKAVYLEADHIEAFSSIITKNNIKTLEEAESCEELWNINNGRTLCKKCHGKTDNFGGKSNQKKYKTK